jgi:hypothetical protein
LLLRIAIETADRGEFMSLTASALAQATHPTTEDLNSDQSEIAIPALIAAGRDGHTDALPSVLKQLASKDPIGRAAAWAAARLALPADLQEAATGKLRQRRNAALALSCQIAVALSTDQDSTAAQAASLALLEAEIQRARDGGTASGETAATGPALAENEAVLPLLEALIQADDFADRFEIERLRKIVQDGAPEVLAELAAPAEIFLAESLSPETAPEPAAELDNTPDPSSQAGPSGSGHDLVEAPAVPPPFEESTAVETTLGPGEHPQSASEADSEADETAEDSEENELIAIDWATISADPRIVALGESMPQLVQQIGPLLENIAAQAAGKPLLACVAEEVAAIFLQVLPQALPPQYVQAVLAPEALTTVQTAAQVISDLAGEGDEIGDTGDQLQAGIGLVREAMREQIRASGMLGGPDYSDPEISPG